MVSVTFGDVIEEGPYGPRQTKSVAEHVCDLAEGGEMVVKDRGDPGKAVGKLARTDERRAAWRRDRA